MHRIKPPRTRRRSGFSLVELIVVIVITGIMASTVGLFIAGPIQSYFDQARRAALVDAAQLALTRMGRDLRAALPNSVRTGAPNAIELLLTLDGDRYRAESPGSGDDRLTAGITDLSFNTFLPLGTCTSECSGRFAVYPLNSGSGAYPYDSAALSATGLTYGLSTVSVSGQDESRITLSAEHRFPFDSPSRRIYLVQGPVSYLCDGVNLLRYENYAVEATQRTVATGAGGFSMMAAPPTPVVVTRNVSACTFSYAPASTATRNAVITLALTLSDSGESIRLLRQVQVDNTP